MAKFPDRSDCSGVLAPRRLHLRRTDGRLWIYPLDDARRLRQQLEDELSYMFIQQLQGKELRESLAHGGSRVKCVPTGCFYYDEDRRFVTLPGFRKRIQRLLKAEGVAFDYLDLTPHPRPEVFKPRWDLVEEAAKLRHKQRYVLERICRNEFAAIDCATGYGKSFLIWLVTRMWPKARIDIVCKSAEVIRQIHEELSALTPNVGLIGAGKSVRGHRLQCYCAASLHKSDGDADVLIGDEIHQLATPLFLKQLSRYKHSRNYGFSATINRRSDGADMEVEGIFGPVTVRVGYAEAKDKKLVVPIRVRWRNVVMDVNPCADMVAVNKKRWGLWRNDYRNQLIAEDAAQYDANTQVLIAVDTVEHAVFLKKLLPDFTLVYDVNGLSAEKRARYIRWKLLKPDEPLMTTQRRKELKRLFSQGKLKKAIATTVWDTGVDFRRLQVLCLACAPGGDIRTRQWKGRLARNCPEIGKTEAILHDYNDCFDTGLKRNAQNRKRLYKEDGHEQELERSSHGRRTCRDQMHLF